MLQDEVSIALLPFLLLSNGQSVSVRVIRKHNRSPLSLCQRK